jgi:Zn-dependent protease
MAAGSVRIGSAYGIGIEIDSSLVLLILFGLLLTAIAPGLILLDLIIALLFICVLIHELAHSVTALVNGVKVKKIVLLPWGGASVIDTDPLDPVVEFRISAAGPLMNLFLGGLFGMIAVILPPGLLELIVQEMFVLNVFLGVANLVPSFPLDGGRIFRSYMKKRHNEYDATKITVKVSKIMLVLIMVATVAVILYYNSWSLLRKELVFVIDLVVVWFFYGGVKVEEGLAEVKKQAGNLTVRSVISKNFSLVSKDDGAASLYTVLKNQKPHIVVTKLDSGYAVIDFAMLNRMKNMQSVAQIATPIPSFGPQTKLADVIPKMEGEGFGIAVVVNKGQLLGVLTYTQIRAYISLSTLGRHNR